MKNNLLKINQKSNIHPTAIIDSSAVIHENVSIGAYSIIGKEVVINNNTEIGAHVVVDDYTSIGENCKIYTGAVLGSKSQDLKADGEKSFLIIGDNNIIREYVTINRSSNKNDKTLIGNNNSFLTYSHIGHDCLIGNNNVFSNSVNIGGYCIFEDFIVVGGIVGVHQFVKVGSHAMIGGMSRVTQDVPPYFVTVGNPVEVEGVNILGLKRSYFELENIILLKKAWEIIYNKKLTLSESLQELQRIEQSDEILYLIDFLKQTSKRGLSGLKNSKK